MSCRLWTLETLGSGGGADGLLSGNKGDTPGSIFFSVGDVRQVELEERSRTCPIGCLHDVM